MKLFGPCDIKQYKVELSEILKANPKDEMARKALLVARWYEESKRRNALAHERIIKLKSYLMKG